LKIDLIAGARPNFMKIAPIIDAIHKAQDENINISYRLIHTGQHYDKNMSDSFFEQLGIPEPNVNLGAGGGTIIGGLGVGVIGPGGLAGGTGVVPGGLLGAVPGFQGNVGLTGGNVGLTGAIGPPAIFINLFSKKSLSSYKPF
jgi:hypothetical protein